MFLAVGMDGNNQILPIGYGIGKSEDGESWTWFLSKLKECIGEHPDLVIISDRAASIQLAVRVVFPRSFHGLCCRHLMVNLRLP
ncbi:putative MULE transposase domain-containing protein [Helianthus annuus]|uniref:MULE transposase domain-containing protein n=1 Tax=Helianthus annuus TaxID=4232 RepID=A0A9K3N9N5_HELAN|nr:putative MULE transposase domain-containing protein [Helianthus annuus]